MICFSVCLSILAFGLSIVLGQNDRFEYECDVLTKLDNLERALTEAVDRVAVLDAKVKDADDTIAGLDTRVRDADDQIVSLTSQLKEANANQWSTYVRWGRKTCPGNGTQLVYSGIAGGSSHEHQGGAVNYICLPETPVYGTYFEDDAQTNGGRVFGAEYQLDGRHNDMRFFPDLPESPKLLDKNVPCAVCRSNRSTMLMVPAQNICMDGWTEEYSGLLVSNHFSHPAASEYICLDGKPEYLDQGWSDQEGKLLYFVEGRCGSLPCPPYENGRELTCAVCTK